MVLVNCGSGMFSLARIAVSPSLGKARCAEESPEALPPAYFVPTSTPHTGANMASDGLSEQVFRDVSAHHRVGREGVDGHSPVQFSHCP